LKGRAHEVQAERFKQFFKAQFEMGVIPSNPAKDLKKPKVDKDPAVAFDRDQRDRLLDAVKGDPRLLAANLVFAYTGLAPVDLVHLGPQKLRERRGSLVYRHPPHEDERQSPD
jgi:site-specific recombinase XerC